MKRSIDLSVNLVHSAENCSGPLHGLDRATLLVLEHRYERFLTLAHAHPQAQLVPTGDIDEMWHLHMLHPCAYFHDCMTLFGTIVDHHPDFAHADAATRAQLDDGFATTAALWLQAYGEPYMLDHLGAGRADAAALDLGAAYCAESVSADAGVHATKPGAAYCAGSFARAPVALGAAHCAESFARRPVALGAAYCAVTTAAAEAKSRAAGLAPSAA